MTPLSQKIELIWQEYKEKVYSFAFELMGQHDAEATGLQCRVYAAFMQKLEKHPDLLADTKWPKTFFLVTTRNMALNRLRWLKHGK